jgi:hypothetical protein
MYKIHRKISHWKKRIACAFIDGNRLAKDATQMLRE